MCILRHKWFNTKANIGPTFTWPNEALSIQAIFRKCHHKSQKCCYWVSLGITPIDNTLTFHMYYSIYCQILVSPSVLAPYRTYKS